MLITALFLLLAADPIRPGVWATTNAAALPLPSHGYQVYAVGEMHGLAENEAFQLAYLTQLRDSGGVRDVAIEEDQFYQEAAEDFVSGRADHLPDALCLRAAVLEGIRRLNTKAKADQRIHVHLTDVDSPADVIRAHLLRIQVQLKAAQVKIPVDIKKEGLAAVEELSRLSNGKLAAELRTVKHSLRCLLDGLEVGTGMAKGSPFLEDREQAITRNIADLAATRPVLVLYGSDHVSRRARADGGPRRDQSFEPMTLRLTQAGLRVFALATFPLTGRLWWRGRGNDLLWTAEDGKLSSGETLAHVLASAPNAKFLYIDRTLERAQIPSQDISNSGVDGFLLFPAGHPITDHCASHK